MKSILSKLNTTYAKAEKKAIKVTDEYQLVTDSIDEILDKEGDYGRNCIQYFFPLQSSN